MKPKHFISVAVFAAGAFIAAKAQAQSNYQSTSINGQVWMAKNLDVSTFRNGDTIPQVTSEKDWVKAGEKKQPAWCYYGNDPYNASKFGKLYNWYALTDPRGLAPQGWRIPVDEDFKKLITQYQNDRKLLYAVLIEGGISGMNIPLGGWRGRKGDFKDKLEYGAVWSATEKGKWVSYIELAPIFQVAGMREAGKEAGLYVRCIKE